MVLYSYMSIGGRSPSFLKRLSLYLRLNFAILRPQRRSHRIMKVFPRIPQFSAIFSQNFANFPCICKKGKGFPYSLPSVGLGADPGVQAASPQEVIHPAVGCHYFPPGLRLPSQPQSITAPWPVPSYTAW